MARSLKRLHFAALAGILACLLLAAASGYLLFSDLRGTLSRTGGYYILFILVALGTVAIISITVYRTLGAVRADIRSLVQMFRDVHQGAVRSDYPVEFTEFAVAQRYLRGWGRELLVEKERLTEQGMVDHLSQLSNRRHFEMRLKEVFDNTRTHGPSSVLIIDVDHFKQVNDRHGHDAGDTLIVRFAAALRDSVRHTDMLARIGGDEFCIVYTYITLEKAKELADRLRQALPREFELKPNVVHELRWTGGLSVIDSADTKSEDVLWRADQALLRAKEAGRDRTVVYDPPGASVRSTIASS